MVEGADILTFFHGCSHAVILGRKRLGFAICSVQMNEHFRWDFLANSNYMRVVPQKDGCGSRDDSSLPPNKSRRHLSQAEVKFPGTAMPFLVCGALWGAVWGCIIYDLRVWNGTASWNLCISQIEDHSHVQVLSKVSSVSRFWRMTDDGCSWMTLNFSTWKASQTMTTPQQVACAESHEITAFSGHARWRSGNSQHDARCQHHQEQGGHCVPHQLGDRILEDGLIKIQWIVRGKSSVSDLKFRCRGRSFGATDISVISKA